MDRERLGRVLGKTARFAARSAMEAMDAATAPAPAADTRVQPEILRPRSAAAPARAAAPPAARPVAPTVVRAAQQAATSFQATTLQPLRAASRSLWFELTGSFFALFGASFALGAWHARHGLHSGVAGERNRLIVFCVLMLGFGYFSATSFLRARKR